MRRQAGRKYDHTMYSMYIEADKFHQRLPVHTSNNITNSSRQQLHLKGQFLLSSALKIIICNISHLYGNYSPRTSPKPTLT